MLDADVGIDDRAVNKIVLLLNNPGKVFIGTGIANEKRFTGVMAQRKDFPGKVKDLHSTSSTHWKSRS